MRRTVIISIILFFITGCSTLPIRKGTSVPLDDVEPTIVRENFLQELASKFEILSTISFYYKRQAFAGIGYTAIDAPQRAFTVTCLNPAGIKLFELKGKGDTIERIFLLDQFEEYGDVHEAVAKDIKKIYFDCIPAVEAEVNKKKYKIIFTQPFLVGEVEYIFTGEDARLTEKRYRENNRKVWSVYYSDYIEKNGKIYPGKIMFKHHQYHYRLSINTKEIYK